jgi:hypothetical protein
MGLNKRAIFFTLIAVLLSAILILSIPILQKTNETKGIHERIKVTSMDQFISDLEADYERELRITGFRALLGAQEYVALEDAPISDAQDALKSAFMNGTIGNRSLSILTASTFAEWLLRIRTEAAKVQLDLNMSPINISFYQESPWTVTVHATYAVTLFDSANTTSWDFNLSDSVPIPIEGMEDPLFTLYTSNLVSRQVNKTTHEGSYTTPNSAANLMDHTRKGMYRENPMAPSYMMRFENNLSASPYGIESLINLPEFELQGVPIFDRTIVDYLYFSNYSASRHLINTTDCGGGPCVDQVTWFYLDDNHTVDYMVAAPSPNRLLT